VLGAEANTNCICEGGSYLFQPPTSSLQPLFSNRDTKRLETRVTPRKQKTRHSSNRDKSRLFPGAIALLVGLPISDVESAASVFAEATKGRNRPLSQMFRLEINSPIVFKDLQKF